MVPRGQKLVAVMEHLSGSERPFSGGLSMVSIIHMYSSHLVVGFSFYLIFTVCAQSPLLPLTKWCLD